MDALVYPNSNGQYRVANDVAASLPKSPDWRAVSPYEAQRLANEGVVAVGVQRNPGGHGHMVTVRPELQPGSNESIGAPPTVNNVGKRVGVGPDSWAFEPGQPVNYYVPNDKLYPE